MNEYPGSNAERELLIRQRFDEEGDLSSDELPEAAWPNGISKEADPEGWTEFADQEAAEWYRSQP